MKMFYHAVFFLLLRIFLNSHAQSLEICSEDFVSEPLHISTSFCKISYVHADCSVTLSCSLSYKTINAQTIRPVFIFDVREEDFNSYRIGNTSWICITTIHIFHLEVFIQNTADYDLNTFTYIGQFYSNENFAVSLISEFSDILRNLIKPNCSPQTNINNIYQLDMAFNQMYLPELYFNGSYYEPKMNKHYGHDKLILVGDIQSDLSPTKTTKDDGRKATVDIIKKWQSYNLHNLLTIAIINFPLKYLRADDFACMPILEHIYIRNCQLKFFSGLSFYDVNANYFFKYNSEEYLRSKSEYKWYKEMGINRKHVQEILEETGLWKSNITSKSEWSWKCLQYATKVTDINLSLNELQDGTVIINASLFSDLKHLLISNNKLKSLPIYRNIPFSDTFDSSLRDLDVSNNLIDNFSNIDLIGHIRFLNLSNNNIQYWNKSDVLKSNNHAIDIVDLSHNEIRSLNKEMLMTMSKGTLISLVGNPFDCDDCSIPAFQTILQNKSFVYVDEGWEFHKTDEKMQYFCSTPKALSSIPIQKVKFNDDICKKNFPDYSKLVYGISVPLTVIFIISLLLGYFYRFHFAYTMHLFRLKRHAQERQILPDSKVFDAFISYSQSDKAWVHNHLLKHLENGDENYAICLHDRDFPVGAYIMNNIVQGLESCRHVILVLSSAFISSKWCQWELKLIQHMIFENKTPYLIIVELEHLCRKDIPLSLRLLAGTRTFLEWNILQQRQFWKQLRQILGTPLTKTQLDPVIFEENHPEQIVSPTLEDIKLIIEQNLASCDEQCDVNDRDLLINM